MADKTIRLDNQLGDWTPNHRKFGKCSTYKENNFVYKFMYNQWGENDIEKGESTNQFADNLTINKLLAPLSTII